MLADPTDPTSWTASRGSRLLSSLMSPGSWPTAPLGYESFEHHSAGCSQGWRPAIYQESWRIPTDSRPALFLALSASLVSSW
jgi:hypothetical protein